MTYITGSTGTEVANNTNTSLAQTAWNTQSGTISSASTTITTGTFVLSDGESASSSDDAYNNLIIEISSGAGSNRYYSITDYTGSTRTCTISGHVGNLPESGSGYIIHTYSGVCQTQDQSVQFKTVKIKSGSLSNNPASTADDFHNECFIKLFNSIDYSYQIRRIIDYDGSTNIATIDSITEIPITNTTIYIIIGESGTAQNGTSTTILLEASHGHNTTDDHYNNLYIEIYAGTGSGQTRQITDYTGSNLTCTVATWTTNPDSTSVYNIYSGWGAETFSECTAYTESTLGLTSLSTERAIIYQQLGLTNNNLNNRGKYSENSTVSPSSAHTLTIISPFYKVKLVSIGTTLTGSVVTIFHTTKNKGLTSFIEEPINNNNDCELTRSVITGKTSSGIYKNVIVSDTGNLNTEIISPSAAFGELSTIVPKPVSQISFPYFKNTSLISEFFNHGTVTTMSTEGSSGISQVQLLYTPPGSLLESSGYGSYFFINSTTTTYYIWFNVNSGNSDPEATGTGVEVTVNSASDTSSEVAIAVKSALDGISGGSVFTTSILLSGNLLQITNDVTGSATSIQLGTMPLGTASTITYNKSESTLSITNAPGIESYSQLQSKRLHQYRPGQGGLGRFSALFDTPTTGVQQIAGIGNQVSGFFFGVDPSDGKFGILHRQSGLESNQVLTITNGTGESTETATIVIDGVTFSVSLTASQSTSQVAEQIASAVDANGNSIFLLNQWITDSVGTTVIFLSETATGSRATNTYSFSSTGSATGTWESMTDGTAVVNTWITQDNWNEHKLNGYETTGMKFNPTLGNVFQIQYEWLGFGAVKFYIEDVNNGRFLLVHQLKYANSNTIPNISQPAMKLIWGINTTNVTTSATMKMVSGGLFNEGEIYDFNNVFSKTQTYTTTTSNEEHVVTYRNLRSFNGKGNNTIIKPKSFYFTNDATKGAIIRVYTNPIITNPLYAYINENSSSLVYDSSGTVSGGTLRYSFGVAGGTNEKSTFSNTDDMEIRPNEIMTITVQRTTNTNVELTSVFIWHEDQ